MPRKLVEDQLTPCALMALDVVGHSSVVSTLPNVTTAKLFESVEARVRTEVKKNGGELLGWQGDGGIALFPSSNALKDKDRVFAALSTASTILSDLPNINANHHLSPERRLHLRVALHYGSVIWHRARGSIHSQDVNFVAHLEHALPEDVIGISEEVRRNLDREDQESCLPVGHFEGHDVFIFARDETQRLAARERYVEKKRKQVMGELCREFGLVHVEFRDQRHPIPPESVYENAQDEILVCGFTLASSFKDEITRAAWRDASKLGRRLLFLILDPSTIGESFATSAIDPIILTLKGIASELRNGGFRSDDPGLVQIRGLTIWPHYTGVMVDGDARNGPIIGDRTHGISVPQIIARLPDSLVLRVQTKVPPETGENQHLSPVFEYRRYPSSTIMAAYVSGFRYYWQNSLPLDLQATLAKFGATGSSI